MTHLKVEFLEIEVAKEIRTEEFRFSLFFLVGLFYLLEKMTGAGHIPSSPLLLPLFTDYSPLLLHLCDLPVIHSAFGLSHPDGT